MNHNPFEEPERFARKSLRVALLVIVLIAIMVDWDFIEGVI